MTRLLNTTRFTLAAVATLIAMHVASPADAAVTSVADLESTTPTTTIAQGTIASSRVNDTPVDADADVDSTADITLAFEATVDDTTPGGNRVFFEFGGGNGTGFSLLSRTVGDLTIQVENGSTQIGGNASSYTLPTHKVGTTVGFVASLDVDGASSILRLFADGDLVYSGSGGPVSDWSSSDTGGFFDANTNVLAAAFSNQNFNGPSGSEATAESGLRFYEGVVVSQESSVTFAFGDNASNSDAMFGASGYDNASDFLNNSGVSSDTLTDSVTGNNLNMTVDPSANITLAGDVGLGDTANASTSWNAGDIIDLTFDQSVRLDTIWANHGSTSPRTVSVQVILNPGADQVDLGTLTFSGVKQLNPTYALEFGDQPGGDTILSAGDVLRLIAPSGTDPGRIAGVTVQIAVPAPAALPAGLAMLGLIASRRRRVK